MVSYRRIEARTFPRMSCKVKLIFFWFKGITKSSYLGIIGKNKSFRVMVNTRTTVNKNVFALSEVV
jgi:hypothetical protein